MSRPLPQTGLPVRQSNARTHSHSVSLGAVNTNHRVTRRKSVTSTAAANAAAAMAASLKDTNGEPSGVPITAHRRALSHRKAGESTSLGTASGLASYLSRSINNPNQDPNAVRKASLNSDEGTAVEGSNTGGKPVSTTYRNRRASEGSHLVKSEGKRTAAELRCERCGKGYKHGSCLSKHMWEHDPAWAITSKLLISKHQQVQLLEAATVLVNMNQDSVTEATPEAESEASSASPGASSEVRDNISSTETTPPPMEKGEEDDDDDFEMSGMPVSFAKRFSVSNASAYSRSYQSVPSSSFNGSAPLHSPAFSHFRQSSIDTRPSTAETKLHEDDEADLAAAIGLCNFGTPRSGPLPMSPDVPPVPPLPARFVDQRRSVSNQGGILDRGSVDNAAFSGSNPNVFLSVSLNPSLSYKVSDEREVRTGDADRESRHRRNDDVDFGTRHAIVDDDDDGVFGRMEE